MIRKRLCLGTVHYGEMAGRGGRLRSIPFCDPGDLRKDEPDPVRAFAAGAKFGERAVVYSGAACGAVLRFDEAVERYRRRNQSSSFLLANQSLYIAAASTELSRKIFT